MKTKITTFENESVAILADYFSADCSRVIRDHFGQNAFHVVTADPPYGNIVKKSWDKKSHHEALEFYLDTVGVAFDDDIAAGGVLAIWWGIGKPGCRPGYEFCARAEQELDLEQIEHITWRKRRAYGTATNLLFVREELSVFKRKGEKHHFNVPYLDKDRGYPGFNKAYPAKSSKLRRTNVWDDVTELFKGKIHECEKPVRLYEIIYGTWNRAGSAVLDIYGGSGAAAEAARNLGLRFCIVENDPEAFEVLCNRLGASDG